MESRNVRALRARYRTAAALAFAVALLVGFWTFGATEASAHRPLPQLHVMCATASGWDAHFVVDSWNKTLSGGGGNPHVEVAYQVDSGPWTTLPWQSSYQFTTANDFQFTGTFHLPFSASAQKVHVKAWATATWSDGDTNDMTQTSAWVTLPRDCGPTTTTSTAPSTSTSLSTSTSRSTSTTLAPTTTVAVSPTSVVRCVTTTTGATSPSSTSSTPTTVSSSMCETTTTTAAPSTTVAVAPTSLVNTSTTPTTTSDVAGVSLVNTTPTTAVAVMAATVSALPVTGAPIAGLTTVAVALLLGGLLLVRAARVQTA